MASSSHQALSRHNYVVFLSFRGKDTRYTFTDHLYHQLREAGLVAFRDDPALQRGEAISPALMKAIEESRCSVVVLSKNYASSSWCLEELAKIMECHRLEKMKVFPVFYGVDPSEVRKQTGGFGSAFAQHEERFGDDLEKVDRRRNALRAVANLSGWDIQNRYESECIGEIVESILRERSFAGWTYPKELVGMDSRLVKLMSSEYLHVESDEVIKESAEVIMVGICGMGGIGKTTIAHAIYHRISNMFQGSSFLENIKGNTLLDMQKQLLRDTLKDNNEAENSTIALATAIMNRLKYKRIFLVLDDVDQPEQLVMLAGRDWFGPGSRIIVTSRNEHLLSSHGATKIYAAQHLNEEEAFQLFVNKAFKGDRTSISGDYQKLIMRALNYAGGLPLALEVIGSFLCGRTIDEWRAAMDKLKEFPHKKIYGILRLSYDGLDEREKAIFLDIACFFRLETKDWVTRILDSCGFHPKIDIPVLVNKSLITISNDKIQMHDLIQQMGWEIVRKESPEEPGRRSRIWRNQDVNHILTNNKGTNKIEGIVPYRIGGGFELGAKAFSEMKMLKYLKLNNGKLLNGGLDYLSNELRLVNWFGCPLKSFPSTFQPRLLVELHLCRSNIQQLFPGLQSSLEKLRVLNLSSSAELVKIPNLEYLPNLEELNLNSCESLSEICPSVLEHKKLVTLNMGFCTKLSKFPDKIWLESLRNLQLLGCVRLEKFPEITGNMNNLTTLSLAGTAVRELPHSMRHLTGLKHLDLQWCQNLITIPSCICDLQSLRNLELEGCKMLEHLPDNIGNLELLEKIELSCTSITRLPSSFARLKSLEYLVFSRAKLKYVGLLWSGWIARNAVALPFPSWLSFRCLKNLDLTFCHIDERTFPKDLDGLIFLEELYLHGNDIISLPESISSLSKLKILGLCCCPKLVSLPRLPLSLISLGVIDCPSLEKLPDLLFERTSEKLMLHFQNCFKIVKNKSYRKCLTTTVLRNYLLSHPTECQVEECRDHTFEITLPGSSLPVWFQHHYSEGDTVKLQIPSDLHTSTIRGILFGAVFLTLITCGMVASREIPQGVNGSVYVLWALNCLPVMEMATAGSLQLRLGAGIENNPSSPIIYGWAFSLLI